MTIHVPFRLPLSGFAECKKVQANFDFLTDQLENLNAGVTAWDAISVGTGGSVTGAITFYNASNSNTLGLRAGATSPSYTLTLPTSAGSSGQVLSTDGSGVTSWVLRANTTLSNLEDTVAINKKLNNFSAGLITADNLSDLGYLDMLGIANPAAPAAGTARFHAVTTNGFTRFEQDNEAATNITLGRDEVFICRNTTASTITKGSPVYITGATGNMPNIGLAKADSLTTLPAIGIALDNISANAFGQVMKTGSLVSFNTSGFSVGDTLYVSGTTAGALTATRPVSPLYTQRIGTVGVSNVAIGMIIVTTAPFVGGVESGTTSNYTFAGTVTLSNYLASQGLLYVGATGALSQLGFDTGKVLTSTSGAYAFSSLTGTSNQVIITPTAGVFTFSLPQSIATSSVVRFGQVIMKDGTVANPNLVLTAGASAENTGLNGTGSSLSFIVAGALQGAIDNAGGIAMLGEVRGLTSRVTASMAISSGSSGTVTIQASSPSGGTYVLTLPVDDGTPNQVLTTDGSGVLSWTTPSGAGANTTLSNLADTVAINKNLNNFSAGTITASLTGAASLNLLLTGGMLTGDLTLDNNKALILREATGNGTDSVSIKTPAALAAAYTLTLPTTDGNANEVLTTDGSGVLSWTAVTALGGANTALSNLASVAVNTPLLPGTDIVTDFGSTSKRWRYMYASYTILGGPGSPGWLLMYPPTASNGWAEWGAADNPSNTVTTCIIGSQSGTRQYSVPDAGGNANFVMSAGTATIAGAKTFSSAVTISPTANQLVLGVTRTVTLTAPTPATASRTVSLSDLGGDYDVVGTIGTQTINGNKTFGGVILKTAQPAFLVHSNATQSDATGDGTSVTVTYNSEIFDQASNFNTSTYTFTAPVTGRYALSATIQVSGMPALATYCSYGILTSNHSYFRQVPVIPTDATRTTQTMHISMVEVDMDANDTAYVTCEVGTSTKTADIVGTSTAANILTWFSGSLIN